MLAEILTRTIKIQWSGAALRIPLGFATALRVCLGGDFGASITPSRTGAEPARFLVLAEAGVPPAGSLLILFTELFLEMTSLCLLCAILALAFGGSGQVVSLMTAMIGGYAAIVLSIGALGHFLAHRNAHGPPPDWARAIGLHAGRWRVIQRALRSLRTSIAALRHARVVPMAGAFFASMLHVSLRLAVLPIIALAMNPSLPLGKLVLWPLVFLYGGAVAPAPGGGGAVEFGFKFAFRRRDDARRCWAARWSGGDSTRSTCTSCSGRSRRGAPCCGRSARSRASSGSTRRSWRSTRWRGSSRFRARNANRDEAPSTAASVSPRSVSRCEPDAVGERQRRRAGSCARRSRRDRAGGNRTTATWSSSGGPEPEQAPRQIALQYQSLCCL